MSTIVIKDLPDSIDLDHQAMIAVTGGARTGRRPFSGGTYLSVGIVNFRNHFIGGAARRIDPGTVQRGKL